jgi:hypothetical protein
VSGLASPRHGRLASIVRQHCDFGYCSAATLDRYFKRSGRRPPASQNHDRKSNASRTSSISALVRSKSTTPAPSLSWPPAPAMERALAHAGGRPLLVAMISSLDGRTRHRPIRAKDAAIAGLRSQPPPTCPAVMEELTGVGWHSFGSLVAAGWTRQGRFKPHGSQIGRWQIQRPGAKPNRSELRIGSRLALRMAQRRAISSKSVTVTVGGRAMNNLAQLYNRRFALHLRVKALACQLAELKNLRDRAVRAEQRTLCTTRLAKTRFVRSARAQMHRTAARCRIVLAHPPSDRR